MLGKGSVMASMRGLMGPETREAKPQIYCDPGVIAGGVVGLDAYPHCEGYAKREGNPRGDGAPRVLGSYRTGGRGGSAGTEWIGRCGSGNGAVPCYTHCARVPVSVPGWDALPNESNPYRVNRLQGSAQGGGSDCGGMMSKLAKLGAGVSRWLGGGRGKEPVPKDTTLAPSAASCRPCR